MRPAKWHEAAFERVDTDMIMPLDSDNSNRLPPDGLSHLPKAGALRIGPPPHLQGSRGLLPITVTFTIAAAVVAASGLVLFGWYSLRVLAISMAVTLLVESVFNAIKGRSPSWSDSHALLIGILFACTLPPTTSWPVVFTGALISILLGEALIGGMGNYIWHPVAFGRVAVQILFHRELTPERWPVLGPGKLLWGNVEHSAVLPPLAQWGSHPLPADADAWLVRPVDDLLRSGIIGAGTDSASGLVAFIRDQSPPWRDTLTGLAGGALGEACGVAILIAACLLIWRGFLRWPMLLAAVGAAALTAALLPIPLQGHERLTSLALPGLTVWQGLPVGAAYVMYQLTAGGFLLVVMLLASDPSSSPLTWRGHLWFGAIIGVLTIVLRVTAGLPAAAYWALLAANTLVPIINRLTRRRTFGT